MTKGLESLSNVLSIATRYARSKNLGYIGVELLLPAALSVIPGYFHMVKLMLDQVKPGAVPIQSCDKISYTPRTQQVIVQAGKVAKQLNHKFVIEPHIVIALIDEGSINERLVKAGWHVAAFKKRMLQELDTTMKNLNEDPIEDVYDKLASMSEVAIPCKATGSPRHINPCRSSNIKITSEAGTGTIKLEDCTFAGIEPGCTVVSQASPPHDPLKFPDWGKVCGKTLKAVRTSTIEEGYSEYTGFGAQGGGLGVRRVLKLTFTDGSEIEWNP